jgi:tRNA-2-methylthio-N6-dimethylallyladenosine synthase
MHPDDVPEDVKKRRNNDLLKIQSANSLVDHRRLIGETVEVLVEGLSKHSQKASGGLESAGSSGLQQLTGHTMTDHIVVFDGNERLIGQTVAVGVDDASAFTLFGTVATGERVGVDSEFCGVPVETTATRRLALPLI